MVKKLSPYANEDYVYRLPVEYRCTRKRTPSNSFPMSGRSKTFLLQSAQTGSGPIHSPIQMVLEALCGPGGSVGIATDYGMDGPGSNPGGDEIFRQSRPALGPTQPSVQRVPGLSRM